MDTYKENGIMPESIQEEQPSESAQLHQQPAFSNDEPQQNLPVEEAAVEDKAADGFYHGAGTGVSETITPAIEAQDNVDETAQQSEGINRSKRKKRKKKGLGKKIFKCSVVTLLILALIAAGCGISVAVTNRYWWSYYQNVQRNFEEQIQLLRQELETHQDVTEYAPSVPSNGLTPTQVYHQNINSVVAINCVMRTTVDNKVYESQSSGSGFVLTQDGYIVTNHHVIDQASKIYVIFANGKSLSAELIGSDSINDVALLKVAANNLDPVQLGDSASMRVGDQVVAIGNALGELSFSLTVGYVSGMDRRISTDGTVMNMIQTDTSINSGNSGGPLFNTRGEVIGITTAKYSGTTSSGASIEGISFAIPVDDVLDILEDLRQFGYVKSAYLGISGSDVDPAVADNYNLPMGVLVQDVVIGFASHKAGLQPKDIITNLGGYRITCMSDLYRALRNIEPGQETTITVYRGRYIVLSIVLDEKPRN